jgi:hypothetical protein
MNKVTNLAKNGQLVEAQNLIKEFQNGGKIINRAYNEIFTNGSTDWLLGNVGDWQNLDIEG